jgi:hypothetical protein
MSKYTKTSKYKPDDDDTSGFVDINNYYNKATDVKVKNLNMAIQTLKNSMKKYIEDCTNMWEQEIVAFAKSSDCMIFTDAELSVKNYEDFIEFMKSQKPYKIMSVSLARFEERKDYILRKA